MEYNHAPISLREGHVYLDGVEIADSIKCEIKFTPDVWTGRQLGELTPAAVGWATRSREPSPADAPVSYTHLNAPGMDYEGVINVTNSVSLDGDALSVAEASATLSASPSRETLFVTLITPS